MINLNRKSYPVKHATQLRGASLHAARLFWYALTALATLMFMFALPAYFTTLNSVCMQQNCLELQVNMGRAIALELTGFSFQFYAILITIIQVFLFALYLSIGIFLFVRRSDDWLTLIVSLTLITSIHADMYRVLLNENPELTFPALLLSLINSTLLISIFYIFPTGNFYPRWTILLAVVTGITLFAGVFTYNSILAPQGWPAGNDFVFFLIVFLPAMFVMLFRYQQVLNPVQRQQTRWVVFGIALTWGGELVLTLFRNLVPVFQQNAGLFVFLNIVTLLWTTILPVSILIAVLRSHLWDIDLIIRRTLIYTVLTVILAVIYFGSIILFQEVIQNITGEQSPIVTIIITLVIAALVNPLRQIVQNYIEQLFYRRRYNAEQIMEEFSLSLRSEVDLDQLTDQLITLVRDTMQPEFISLWLAHDRLSDSKKFVDQIEWPVELLGELDDRQANSGQQETSLYQNASTSERH